jgi:hypothetical protein
MGIVLGEKRGARRGSGDDVFCTVALIWDYLVGGLLNLSFPGLPSGLHRAT